MIKIKTHEASNGRWYSSTTYNGMDIFEEGRTANEAIENMVFVMRDKGIPENNLQFEPPVPFQLQTEPKSKIGLSYRPTGIDNNPIA